MKATAMGKLTRDDALSCSQLPALLRQDAYGKTPNDVLRRCCEAIRGNTEDFTPNEAMQWGSRLELVIVEEAAERLGMELSHGFTEPFICTYAPLQCSLDAKIKPVLNKQTITTDIDRGVYVLTPTGTLEVEYDGCLEAKLTSMSPEDTPPLHRGPLQLQGQMMCTGAKWGAVATLYRGTELRIFVFAEHPETQAAIAQAARDFEARLVGFHETGEIEWYPLDSSDDGSRTFPVANDVEIELPDNLSQWAALYVEAASQIKAAEKVKEEATTKLMDAMGPAEKAHCGAYQITWGSRSYKAQPEKVVPAKEAYTVRNKSISVRGAL